jgi:hypothetical protein
MSHAEARPTACEAAAKETNVEALLHLASTYQPELPAPENLEARVGERLRAHRLPVPWWPRRAVLPVAALASGVVAVLFWPFVSPRPTERTAKTASPAISFVSSRESSTPRIAEEQPAQIEPFTTVAHRNDVAPTKRAASSRRRAKRHERWRRTPRRSAPVPTVRWEVEVVEREVERAVTPGWWITRNETTGDLEATPAAREVVSAREISPASVSCAPPEMEPSTESSTTGQPEPQPGEPQESPKE